MTMHEAFALRYLADPADPACADELRHYSLGWDYAAAVSAADNAALREQIGLYEGTLESRDRNIEVLRKRVEELEAALRAIDAECFSHIDGRDLFAQLHPRNMLDIKRRVDARETWFEGDWLTNLWGAIKAGRTLLSQPKEPK